MVWQRWLRFVNDNLWSKWLRNACEGFHTGDIKMCYNRGSVWHLTELVPFRWIFLLVYIIFHQTPAEGRLHICLHSSLVLGRQTVGQAIQSWVQGPGHVRVRWMRPLAEGWGRAGGQAVNQRSEKVGMAGLAGLHQTVHMNVEGLLLEGAGEGTWREVLKPGEQRQVKFITAIPTEQIHAKQHLTLCDLLTSCFTLENRSRELK